MSSVVYIRRKCWTVRDGKQRPTDFNTSGPFRFCLLAEVLSELLLQEARFVICVVVGWVFQVGEQVEIDVVI